MAVVIPVEEYEQFLKQREGDFSVIDEIRTLHKAKSPEGVERDVSEAIKRVRASKKAKTSHEKGRS